MELKSINKSNKIITFSEKVELKGDILRPKLKKKTFFQTHVIGI